MPRATARNYHDIKRGWWNGKWYDSSWELALIVYYYDHDKELTRNLKKFPYKWRNKTLYYQPDFVDENGYYIEVKGIVDTRAKRKMDWFPYPLTILGKKEMQIYIQYMIDKYGKDWISLF